MDFWKLNQKHIRRCAHSATEHVLTDIDLTALSEPERAILTDITFRLLLKYFNGRELKLLGNDYLTAEFADTLLERNEEITNSLAVEAAVAQIAVALGTFFKEHD